MVRKGEKMSPEHLAKMMAARKVSQDKRKAAGEPLRRKKVKALVAASTEADLALPPAATKPLLKEVIVQPKVRGKKILKNPEDAPVAVKKGVKASGETKKQEAADFVKNTNTGMSAVVSNQLSGQKKELKKALKTASEMPKLSDTAAPQDKTIAGLKTNDPAAVEGRAPFSIQALRNKLLA